MEDLQVGLEAREVRVKEGEEGRRRGWRRRGVEEERGCRKRNVSHVIFVGMRNNNKQCLFRVFVTRARARASVRV